MGEDRTYLVLRKGEEHYCFCYDESTREELEKVFLRFAEQADLSFSRRDAAMLSREIQSEQGVGYYLKEYGDKSCLPD